MGDVLAGVYSRSDAFKRKLIDALRNPGATVDQVTGRMVDDLRSAREQLSAAASEGTTYGPATEALAMKMANAYSPGGMTKVVGPQSEALEIARQNGVKMLGLPEANTAMDRAKALGFDVNAPMYHATDKDFQSFIPSTKGKLGAGVYLSPNSKYAERYSGDEARVLPVLTRGKFANDAERTDIADAVRVEMMKANPNFSVQDWKRNIDKAMQDRGFDGTEMHMERTVYDPSLIRSRFAAFDPARVNKNDLLAGMLPLGAIAVPAGGDNQSKKQALTKEIIDALRKKKD